MDDYTLIDLQSVNVAFQTINICYFKIFNVLIIRGIMKCSNKIAHTFFVVKDLIC